MTAEAVTTQIEGFGFLLPRSAYERTPEPVYPCPILTLHCPKFILMLSSHQQTLSFRVLQLDIP